MRHGVWWTGLALLIATIPAAGDCEKRLQDRIDWIVKLTEAPANERARLKREVLAAFQALAYEPPPRPPADGPKIAAPPEPPPPRRAGNRIVYSDIGAYERERRRLRNRYAEASRMTAERRAALRKELERRRAELAALRRRKAQVRGQAEEARGALARAAAHHVKDEAAVAANQAVVDRLQAKAATFGGPLLLRPAAGGWAVTGGNSTAVTFATREEAERYIQQRNRERADVEARLPRARAALQVAEQDAARSAADHGRARVALQRAMQEQEAIERDCHTRFERDEQARDQTREERIRQLETELAELATALNGDSDRLVGLETEMSGLHRDMARLRQDAFPLPGIPKDVSQAKLGLILMASKYGISKGVSAQLKKAVGPLVAAKGTTAVGLLLIPVEVGVRTYAKLQDSMPTLKDIPLKETRFGYLQYEATSKAQMDADHNRNTRSVVTTANAMLKNAWQFQETLSRMEVRKESLARKQRELAALRPGGR